MAYDTIGSAIKPPTSIINRWSSGGAGAQDLPYFFGYKTILSGALTADTYAEVLNISGSGVLKYLQVGVADATSRTIGLKLEMDGITVFDAVSGTINDTVRGMIIVGVGRGDSGDNFQGVSLEHLPFNNSMVISLKSSLTETNKVDIDVLYNLT